MKVADWFSRKMFNFVHQNNLVYNTCWEDPRLDRVALDLGSDDTVMVITSAGCNVLDYALCEPRHIHAVDMNPRQNALLELKIAGIRNLDHDDFFQLFGRGHVHNCQSMYHQNLRHDLSPMAQKYWDKRIKFFSGKGKRKSFYFRGTAGTLAFWVNVYINRMARVREDLEALLEAKTVEEQQEIFAGRIANALRGGVLNWAMNRDSTLSMLGVPRAQREQIERTFPGGVPKFIRERIETVFTKLPIHDNYFWRVYLRGHYEPDCCPEYLKKDNFEKLKDGLVDRVSTHTSSILHFLERHPGNISRFILLDHMDWLSTAYFPVLEQQWQALVDKAAPETRILWRSGGLEVDFVDPITVEVQGKPYQLRDLLHYRTELTEELHPVDRVHTYGSFYIADLQLDQER